MKMVCKPGISVSSNRPSRVAKGELCSIAVAAIKRSAGSREPSVQCIGRLPERAATSAVIQDFTHVIGGKPFYFLQNQLGIRHNFLTSLTLSLKSPNHKALLPAYLPIEARTHYKEAFV
jgi:hypothetical protein